jgi:hypothetical protein
VKEFQVMEFFSGISLFNLCPQNGGRGGDGCLWPSWWHTQTVTIPTDSIAPSQKLWEKKRFVKKLSMNKKNIKILISEESIK